MYYFAYCTWLHDIEIARFMPEAKPVTKAYAANHALRFHAAGDRTDRGWCHFLGTADAWGERAEGVVFEHDDTHFSEDYDDFERCCVTVHGEDGKQYDCWTYRLIRPGIAMRPPNFYWEHIPTGLKQWNFPPEYIAKVQAVFDAAAECPRADRPNPSAIPGKGADTR
ncbi:MULTISPECIES: gamma-glutamylcyclotransferase family protein [unclassified Shinella]|uniref:gamma-glutamylcyclotransferase family protein n=1 Tax=unclassified Shinella TaxID=2643062 RepID=UPI00225C6EDC|nr:gamma-glutamylcyclotransferase family protein [Shinella sp. YE25]MDC7258903.1 gamma-glutamylcyclotransferase [Shinella sp. YE25]CAI0334320.1 Gamma-glutamyl cyclotransferase [Rhizobiaceae bacterium]CAK7260503.1 Gamma-glutamyl cyclotransferase [Shinella sp. WSC3-e]